MTRLMRQNMPHLHIYKTPSLHPLSFLYLIYQLIRLDNPSNSHLTAISTDPTASLQSFIMGEPSGKKSQVRRYLDEVNIRLAVSRDVVSSSPTLQNQLLFLDDLLTAKEGDGIEETASGQPNLNSDIRTTMQRIAADPRFKDLKTNRKDDLAPEFSTLWGYLERHAQRWKDDDDRMTRLQHGCNLHKAHGWMQGVELDRKRCLGGENHNSDNY